MIIRMPLWLGVLVVLIVMCLVFGFINLIIRILEPKPAQTTLDMFTKAKK